jgi:branched-chain amino acid aminotransferase
MPSGRVLTLEMMRGEAGRVREDTSLAEASAHLPAGAYSTLRTYRGNGLVRFDAHLRRLEESAASQGPPATIDHDVARRLVTTALQETRHSESRLRLTFAPPRLFVSVEPFVPPAPTFYEQGVACVTLPRIHRDQPHAKDTRFIPTARRAYDELPAGIEEGLLLAADGSILEGLSSNFFAVLDGTLQTEEDRVLPGITRALVLEVAARQIPLARRATRIDELPLLDEAFITSASREMLPVVRIDGSPVGDGGVGARTRAIMGGFAALLHRDTEVFE